MRANWKIMVSAMLMLLAVAAVHGQVSVVGSMTQVAQARPGLQYSGTIRVRNDGERAQTVRLLQTDYQFHADGRVLYDEPGSLPRSNASWIALPATTMRVLPGQEVPITYTVRVPDSSELHGTYWSVVIIESELAGTDTSDEGTLGVRHLMRFAVQVVSEFPGGTAELATLSASLERRDTGVELYIAIANTGTRMLRPEVILELYARDGGLHGPFQAAAQRLYPGSSATFAVGLDGVGDGDYRAVAILDAGGDDIFAAQYNLEIR